MVVERIPTYGAKNKSRPVIAGYSKRGEGEGCLKADAFPDNPDKQLSDFIAEQITDKSEKAFCMVGDRDDRKAGTSDKAYCLCAAPQSDMTSRVIKRVGGLYEQATRWGIYDENGIAPTLTASMGMGGVIYQWLHLPNQSNALISLIKTAARQTVKGTESMTKTAKLLPFVPKAAEWEQNQVCMQ